jgi:hypothetical protein
LDDDLSDFFEFNGVHWTNQLVNNDESVIYRAMKYIKRIMDCETKPSINSLNSFFHSNINNQIPEIKDFKMEINQFSYKYSLKDDSFLDELKKKYENDLPSVKELNDLFKYQQPKYGELLKSLLILIKTNTKILVDSLYGKFDPDEYLDFQKSFQIDNTIMNTENIFDNLDKFINIIKIDQEFYDRFRNTVLENNVGSISLFVEKKKNPKNKNDFLKYLNSIKLSTHVVRVDRRQFVLFNTKIIGDLHPVDDDYFWKPLSDNERTILMYPPPKFGSENGIKCLRHGYKFDDCSFNRQLLWNNISGYICFYFYAKEK